MTDTNFASQHEQTAEKQLKELKLPIGWADHPKYPVTEDAWGYTAPFLGWLMTALAATLGAPFWFDVLNKVMVIRSTVKPHEKSPEAASADRQQPASAPAPVQTQSAATSTQAAEDTVDGCDAIAGATRFTLDEDLPETEGGVAA